MMTVTAFWMAALVVCPAFAGAAWIWFATTRVADDLRALGDHEGLHFDA